MTLRRPAAEIGLPRIGVHDLRRTAATIVISSVVPLAVVSKTSWHSTLATTVNIYGHLLPHAARVAVQALDVGRGWHGPYPTSSPTAAPLIVARFTKGQCQPCPDRPRCTTSHQSARNVATGGSPAGPGRSGRRSAVLGKRFPRSLAGC